VSVEWLTGTDDTLQGTRGWGKHISWLHPGQHGSQENRNGNPFLGIVALFDDDNSKLGQFHIGFRSWFSHYFPNNGNIGKNYRKYCAWYGKISGYTPGREGLDFEPDWKEKTNSAPTVYAHSELGLRETVKSFLTEWYIDQNIDDLARFVARDNAVNALISSGTLPEGLRHAYWTNLFSQAFEDGPGTTRFTKLSDALQFEYPKHKVLQSLSSQNESPSTDRFAIIFPSPGVHELFFGDGKAGEGTVDSTAKFLRHLRSQYYRETPNLNSLQIVVYTTIGTGLLKEGCVLYWIKEDEEWKLAAFEGTD
jgi:hypothetical protein